MKTKFSLLILSLFVCAALVAQTPAVPSSKPLLGYQTTIYTDSTLTNELAASADESRGFGADLLSALGNAAVGVATGYISSVVDLGIQALGQLIMLDRKHKQEWQETATRECTFSSSIGTLYALNDFYSVGSNRGALDPVGIQFNGLGCLATVGQDTAYYVSCHLNRQKLNRLRDHSKFELITDTIIINPYHSHLPNSSLPLKFSFAERKNFLFKMTIQILSSWMDFTPTLHQNEVLGEFVLTVPVDSMDVDKNGSFVYIRQQGEPAKYEIMGESFIVPRSYMQIPDLQAGTLHDHYGTGQYSLNVTVEETCDLTPEYRANWRDDRKMRKSLEKNGHTKASFDDVCRTITHQTWDEALSAWVVTILKAPADYSIKTLNEMMRIPNSQQKQQQQQPK